MTNEADTVDALVTGACALLEAGTPSPAVDARAIAELALLGEELRERARGCADGALADDLAELATELDDLLARVTPGSEAA